MEFHSLGWVMFLFALFFNVELVLSTCYMPDGSEQTGPAYQPCDQTVGTISMCCGTNWTATDPRIEDDKCEPNGLCLNNNPSDNQPLYWRGSCTDPTWKSPLCLSNLCTSTSNGGDPTNNVALIQCTDGSWCCGGSNTTCCSEGLGVKIAATIGAAKQSISTPTPSKVASPASTSIPISIAVSASSSPSGSVGSTTTSPSLSTSGLASSSASGSTLLSASKSSSTATNLFAASPSGTSGSPSSTTFKTAGKTQTGLSTGAMAGIGILIGVLVVAAVAGIIWFILWRRKKKQVMVQKPADVLTGTSGYGTPQELPISGRTAYAEMGSKQPEQFQYEVDGYAVVPRAELASSGARVELASSRHR